MPYKTEFYNTDDFFYLASWFYWIIVQELYIAWVTDISISFVCIVKIHLLISVIYIRWNEWNTCHTIGHSLYTFCCYGLSCNYNETCVLIYVTNIINSKYYPKWHKMSRRFIFIRIHVIFCLGAVNYSCWAVSKTGTVEYMFMCWLLTAAWYDINYV
jgi:hypothetical protein